MDLNEYTNITLQNPDRESIEVKYDGKSYGFIEPGTTITLPYFLANHVVKHLINQILNRLKIPLNNQAKRDEWRAKIVINEEQYRKDTPKTEQERLQAEIDRLNARDRNQVSTKKTLDGILGKKREDAPPLPEDTEEVVQTPEVLSPPSSEVAVEASPTVTIPSNPPVAVIGDNPVVTTVSQSVPSGVDPQLAAIPDTTPTETDRTTPPTRQQLYAFLSDELKMNLNDEKTMAYLEAANIENLIEEFNYYEMKA